jgi:hypothetical protein
MLTCDPAIKDKDAVPAWERQQGLFRSGSEMQVPGYRAFGKPATTTER